MAHFRIVCGRACPCNSSIYQWADGGTRHIRKATRPETELAAIYQVLNLDALPGGVQKTYV